MTHHIRQLVESDLVRGSGFYESLESLSEVGDISKKKAENVFEAMKHNTVVFVAEHNGQIVGTTTVFFEHKFIHGGSLVAHIHDVTTRKGFERRGIGRALISVAVEEAKKRGCYKINLECSESNVPFYEKSGFFRNEISMRQNL